MLKVVLDSNVIISAIQYGGNPQIAFEAVVKGFVSGFISPLIISEILGVLSDKFKYSSSKLEEIDKILRWKFILVYPSISTDQIKNDPADNMFLECAAEAGADYIISGDRHLLGLKSFRGIKIANPAEFVKLLEDL